MCTLQQCQIVSCQYMLYKNSTTTLPRTVVMLKTQDRQPGQPLVADKPALKQSLKPDNLLMVGPTTTYNKVRPRVSIHLLVMVWNHWAKVMAA
jgi:hypothetical protein